MKMNPLRWPIIRHIRYFWYRRQVERWVYALGALCMSKNDADYLEMIWHGEI